MSKELKQNGIGRQLLASYKESGWVESFDHGVYKQSGDIIDWTGAVYAIQQVRGDTLHLGGKTALALMGYGHYIGFGKEYRYLFMSRDEHRQSWLSRFENLVQVRTNYFNYSKKEYFTVHSTGSFPINISSPELACIEMLHMVPGLQSFDEAGKITECLYSLRPGIIQKLLEECRSIKVVRLFLFLADYFNHPWLKDLNQQKFNIGKGKRVIVQNGILSNKYQITVPPEYGSKFTSMD